MHSKTSRLTRVLSTAALPLIGLVLFLALPTCASAQDPVYVITSVSDFGTLNLSTGAFMKLGNTGVPAVGLGDFAGNLWIDSQYFWQVNPANGSLTEIGQSSVYCRQLASTTVMYCFDNDTDRNLYSVNPSNGFLTLIGATNLPSGGVLAPSSDAPELYICLDVGSGSVLYSVATNTGAATSIGPTGVSDILSMVYTKNALYAATNGALYTLDTTNGTATKVVNIGIAPTGMAAGPISTFTFRQLHTFSGGIDGATPLAGLTMDAAGNLYGTAYAGGSGYGTAYKLTHKGSGWTFSPLYNFAGGNDGAGPSARLIFGPNGTLYGTTTHGGDGTGDCTSGYTGCGTVFNLKPQARACTTALCAWVETVLYQFQGGDDGFLPYQADLTFDQAGNIYGTTLYGGLYGFCSERWACGTVYELTKSGNTWNKTVLHNFNGNSADGGEPYSGVIFDKAGNLYGTTFEPSLIYELTPSGGSWTEGILNNTCCGYLSAGLIFNSAGNLYGAAGSGGQWGGGLAFEFTPSGSGWVFGDLYDFDDDNRGAGPDSTLLMDKDGNLYGTTQGFNTDYGTVFKLTPYKGGYIQTVMYRFTGGNDGATPYGPLVLDASGNVYGTASAGGNVAACNGAGCGVVFKITPN